MARTYPTAADQVRNSFDVMNCEFAADDASKSGAAILKAQRYDFDALVFEIQSFLASKGKTESQRELAIEQVRRYLES